MDPKTVLIVDDDEDLREVIATKLQSLGLHVTQAANGQEAFEQIDRKPPSLIILDMVMPVMNGWEFAKRFYRRPEILAPIIVMTAASNASQRAEEVGSKYSIGKPIDMQRLISLVEKFGKHLCLTPALS